MSTAFVIGASRGIGLEFVRQYLALGWTVHATYRAEKDRVVLRDLGANALKLDLLDLNDVAGIGWQLDGERIDVAVCNAGVYGPRQSTLRQLPTADEFDMVMKTNVLGPMRLVPMVVPLLEAAAGTLAVVSSRMGSITEASIGYGLLYRTSKAALNMVAKLAQDHAKAYGARAIALHPGWVRTDMGGPNAEVDVARSVEGMRAVIADARAYPGGAFYDYRGETLPW
ncbi:MAG: SDR family oxidoreductase [Burkholderiaceae bacterium]